MGIILTFDDGPDPSATLHLLKVLAQNRVQATFFLIGRRVAKYPAIVKEIAAAGQQIGLHSWNHRLRQSAVEYRAETRALKDLLADWQIDAPVHRYPYGVQRHDARVIGLYQDSVGWSDDSEDWNPARSTQEVLLRFETAFRRASGDAPQAPILLCHDGVGESLNTGCWNGIWALENLLPEWRDRVVPLSTLTSAGCDYEHGYLYGKQKSFPDPDHTSRYPGVQ